MKKIIVSVVNPATRQVEVYYADTALDVSNFVASHPDVEVSVKTISVLPKDED